MNCVVRYITGSHVYSRSSAVKVSYYTMIGRATGRSTRDELRPGRCIESRPSFTRELNGDGPRIRMRCFDRQSRNPKHGHPRNPENWKQPPRVGVANITPYTGVRSLSTCRCKKFRRGQSYYLSSHIDLKGQLAATFYEGLSRS